MGPTRSSTSGRVSALIAIALTVLLGASALPAAAATAADRPTDPIAHDPTIVEEDGWYYAAITGDAAKPGTFLPQKRSRDLVHWEELGPVFRKLPTWIPKAIGVAAKDAPKDLWAPDLSRAGGEWRLYYAASVFGKNTSVIGLATTPTLDPSDPRFGWRDRGEVVRSTDYREDDGDSYNAIDANIAVDADGGTWLTFGSFFSGVYLHRIDPATGKVRAGDEPVHIAERAAPNAEENPAIVFRDGWYYLFLSFDNCCRGVEGDYRTVVARSKAITGPYVDREGRPMLGEGGTELMRGYNEFVGAGGAEVLLGSSHGDLLVNHYYDATDEGAPRLNVRSLTWTEDGWPRAGYPINPSREAGHGDAFVTIRRGDRAVSNAGCGFEGAAVALRPFRGAGCQQWQLSDRGDGTRITNRFSNQVIETAACRNGAGRALSQRPWLGSEDENDCQRWTFGGAPGGTTTVSTLLEGRRSWTADGRDLTIERPGAAAAQRFRFAPVGPVLLGSPTDRTRVLGTTDDRAGFQIRAARDGQEWRFVRVAGGYRVVSGEGKQLAATAAGLRAVDDGRGSVWTLSPRNDGAWSLATAEVRRSIRLLLP